MKNALPAVALAAAGRMHRLTEVQGKETIHNLSLCNDATNRNAVTPQ
jgi:hypothetical protein